MSHQAKYIPALSHDWATPLYDLVIRLTMPEVRFKRQLIEQARIGDADRVLDLGCGTATLTLMIKQAHPAASVHGLDGDPKILEIARSKVKGAGVEIGLDEGMAMQLPYADSSFDRVLSSLVLHHLGAVDKQRACAEVLRVLRPGGELHVADFGKPHNTLMRFAGHAMSVLGHSHPMTDNLEGRLPEILRAVGFTGVAEPTQWQTLFGTLAFYKAVKAA